MPPLNQAYSTDHSYLQDNDDDSTFNTEEEELKPVLRFVRFAEEQNRTYVYPAVSAQDHDRVWYTEEEEHGFFMENNAAASMLSCYTGKTFFSGICNSNDESSEEPKTLSKAILLGSLVMHGVVLRAVLLGHEIVSQL